MAQLDTTTEKAGLSAKVEYSDLKDQEGSQALTKLMQELIPQVRLTCLLEPACTWPWVHHALSMTYMCTASGRGSHRQDGSQ